MARKANMKDSLHNLRDDAAKVLNDISLLTRQFADASSEKSGEFKDHLTDSLEAQMAHLRERLDAVGSDVQHAAKVADKQVRTNPYAFIAGALGLGMLLGKCLFPRHHR